MANVSRFNGKVESGAFYGYQPVVYLVAGALVGTATTGGSGSPLVEGNFDKAIRAIQAQASIVFIGPRADGGFCVILDGSTAATEATIEAAVVAATGVGGATVTLKTLAFAEFA